MPEEKSKNKFGGIIDLSAGDKIAKASRGATKEFDQDLVDHLSQIDATHAVPVDHPDYIVNRADYPATEEGQTAYSNERQRIGAMLRSHALEAGVGKISINWHPDKHYPQCSKKI